MLQHGPRSAPPYLRPLKKKGFKEDRVTTIGLYDIGTSTTLESNKSLIRLLKVHDRNARERPRRRGPEFCRTAVCPSHPTGGTQSRFRRSPRDHGGSHPRRIPRGHAAHDQTCFPPSSPRP